MLCRSEPDARDAALRWLQQLADIAIEGEEIVNRPSLDTLILEEGITTGG